MPFIRLNAVRGGKTAHRGIKCLKKRRKSACTRTRFMLLSQGKRLTPQTHALMVKRLRRRPLTAESGVRFPMRVPKKAAKAAFFLYLTRVPKKAAEAAFFFTSTGVPKKAAEAAFFIYLDRGTKKAAEAAFLFTSTGVPKKGAEAAFLFTSIAKSAQAMSAYANAAGGICTKKRRGGIETPRRRAPKTRNSHDAVWCHFINLHVQGGSTAAACFCLPLDEGA